MQAKTWLWSGLVLVLTSGCTASGPRCTPQSCASGCCTEGGVCAVGTVNAACGISGAACVACSAGTTCQQNECRVTGAAGGSAAGGSAAGGSAGGSTMDAGVSCATASLDPTLGSFVLRASTTVVTSGAVPPGASALGLHNGVLFTVTSDHQLRRLGTLPALSAGPAIVDVRAPADRDGGTFLSGTIASNGLQILTGYTKAGAGAPGMVALVEPDNGAVEYLNAPGNYTAVGLSTGAFIINGLGLGAATGNGLFTLRPGAAAGRTAALTTFPDPFGGSGFTTITANGVLVAGNARMDFSNVARAIVPSTWLSPVATGGTFTYQASNAPLVAEGDTFADLTAYENDVIVVRGGYDAMFNPFTTRVERVPLTLSGSGVQTVSVGTPVALLEQQGLACTRVFAAVGRGADLYLGLEDRQGRRLVKLAP
ncbi:MAG: hypothetical protein JNJ54_04415 [Myxococcaceae bacterium]|nr:hypothetical protein [Myxococcaceae bacterium]